MALRTLGRNVGIFLGLEILTALFVRSAWHPALNTVLVVALAATLIISIIECFLDDVAPLLLYGIRQKIVIGASSLVAIAIALSFCADKLSGLFQ